MSITLRPDTERRIEDRLKAGRYSTADDVVQDGLKLLEQRERERQQASDEVRRRIAVGIDQLDRGEGLDGDRVFKELLAELERPGDSE